MIKNVKLLPIPEGKRVNRLGASSRFAPSLLRRRDSVKGGDRRLLNFKNNTEGTKIARRR